MKLERQKLCFLNFPSIWASFGFSFENHVNTVSCLLMSERERRQDDAGFKSCSTVPWHFDRLHRTSPGFWRAILPPSWSRSDWKHDRLYSQLCSKKFFITIKSPIHTGWAFTILHDVRETSFLLLLSLIIQSD